MPPEDNMEAVPREAPRDEAPQPGVDLRGDLQRVSAGEVTGVIVRAGLVAWAITGLALAIWIAGWALRQVAVVFPPLILAGMIVFLLNPLVTVLQRRGLPRAAGAGLAYLAFLGFLTLLVILAIPAISDQSDDLAREWPRLRDRVNTWIDDRAGALEGTPLEFDREEIVQSLGAHEIEAGEVVARVGEIGLTVLNVLLILILAPIFAFYLLVDLPRLRRVAESLVPAGAHDDALLVARRVNTALGGFFRGQLVVAIIVGILSSIAMRIVGLPFWLLIGMIAGFFNLVPLIGPFIGGIPAVAIALTTRDPLTALWAVLALTVVQQIDNHFVSPLVMRRAVKLHPVVVMVVLLLGGTLFGFFGLLVAVPATAVLKIVAAHVWRVRVLGQTPEEWYEESEATDEVPVVGVFREERDEGQPRRFRRLRPRLKPREIDVDRKRSP